MNSSLEPIIFRAIKQCDSENHIEHKNLRIVDYFHADVLKFGEHKPRNDYKLECVVFCSYDEDMKGNTAAAYVYSLTKN